MSGEGKYISLYYNLVQQNASDFYKEISKGPEKDMSYLPAWVPPGGGHYPPHMMSQQQPVTSHSVHSALTSSPIGSPSHLYGNPSVAPGSKHQTSSQMPQSNESSPKHVPSSLAPLSPPAPVSSTNTTTSVTQAAAAAAAATAAAVAAAVAASATTGSVSPLAAHTHNGSALDHYQPQSFHRPMSPSSKTHADIKSEIAGLHGLPDLALGLAGPSAFDGKTHRNRSPGKYPAPEQLSSPVMFSYQGRGRPRKHFTHGTGLPTMTPVTHPSTTACDEAEDEESKPFKCPVCGKGFKLKGGLQQHERTHSTDRPYVCPDCGKLFRQPTHLQQHNRIHTGEKPYDCTFCDKSFRQRTILNQHLRIHTGEKPYVCMECGKQFRQKAILDQHYRTHLGEKPFACPHPSCRKHFREMASLISHMKCHKDVADPKIVLQQAKRLIKEEKLDEYISNHESNAISTNNNSSTSDIHSVPHPSSVGANHERASDRDHPTNRYLNSSEHHLNRSYPSPPHTHQRSPHSVHHQPPPPPPPNPPNESQPLAGAMMTSPPQMAVANLFPYHSIFPPSTSYVMGSPDPRQYHQMAASVAQPLSSQSSPVPSRATQ